MKIRNVLVAAASLAALVSTSAWAANLTFGAPVTVSADTDVSTSGTLVSACSLYNGGGTISGVTFASSISSTFTGIGGGTHFNGFGGGTAFPYANLSGVYKNLLSNGKYGLNGTTITLNGLTATHQYAVQLWCNDSRLYLPASAYNSVSAGNTVQVHPNTAGALGGVGQYTIGTFTADGPTQTFTINGSGYPGSGDTYMNAIQLRDLGVTPNLNIGYWNGLGNSTLDNSSLNFCTNLYNTPLGTAASLTTVASLITNIYFADSYYNSSVLTAVTATNITVAAGGVSIGAINLENTTNCTYTFNSSDASGIAGTTAINKDGNGTVILASANTFSGGVNITGGALQLRNANAVSNSIVSINASNGLTFGTGIGTFVAGGLAGVRNAALADTGANAVTLQTGNNGASTVYSGVLSGAGALTQVAGALTLTGKNTYTGGTTVNGGTLALNPILNNGISSVGTGTLAINTGGTVTTSGQNPFGYQTNILHQIVINGGTLSLGTVNCWGDNVTLTNGTLAGGGSFDFQSYSGYTDTATIGGSGSSTISISALRLYATTTFNVAAGAAGNVSSVISQTGGITKNGAGTLTLSGANTYSGATIISAGKLVVSSAQTGTGAITVNDNATLGVTVYGASQLSPSTLTEGSASGPTTNEFTGVSSTTVAPINAGTLTLTGTTTINILSGSFSAGQVYPLIAYTNIVGTGNFVKGTLPYGVTADVVTNGSSIALSVSAFSSPVWNGNLNGTWDIANTANWTLNGVSGKTYQDCAQVLFDDTASGTTTVSNTVTVSPNIVTVSNVSKAYVLGGSAIAGGASLIKAGTGTLTISNANTFTGGVTINGGIVRVSATETAGTSGPLGASGAIAFGGGTLQYSAADTNDYSGRFSTGPGQLYSIDTAGRNVTFGSALSSSGGSLTKVGSGTLTLNAGNTYTGGTTVNGGTLTLATGGTAGIIINSLAINSGATVNANAGWSFGYFAGTCVSNITISGSTLNFTGAAMNGGGTAATSITMTGGTISGSAFDWAKNLTTTPVLRTVATNVSATLSGGIALRFGPSGYLTLNVDSGTVPGGVDLLISGPIFDGSYGPSGAGLTKSGPGTAVLTGNNTYTGGTVISGGTLQIGLGGINGSLPAASSIEDDAALVFNRSDAVTVANVISGSGALIQAGAGTLVLAAASPGFYGTVAVNGGTLSLTGDLGNPTAVNVNSGGIFNGGGTLNCTSSPLTVNNGGTISALIGTNFTINGVGLTLGANATDTTTAIFSGNGSAIACTISVPGGLTLNGTNSIVIQGVPPAAVGTYPLITYGTPAGSGTVTLAPLAPGYTGYVTNDTSANQVQLVLTSVQSLVWVGYPNNNWDFTTNKVWKLSTALTPVVFVNNAVVDFDDTATNFVVNVAASVLPNSATVNSSSNYTFTGNSLHFGGSLLKNGAGRLTLATNNNMATLDLHGGTLVALGNEMFTNLTFEHGTLQLGTGGTNGWVTLPAGLPLVNTDAALVFNRADAVASSGGITGLGSLTQAGPGVLTLSGANTYSGDTTVSGGTLQLGATNVIPCGAGNGNLVINGTLDMNAWNQTVNGLSGAGVVDTLAGGIPTLTAGSNDVNCVFGGTLKNTLGQLALTKVGAGTLTLTGANTNSGPVLCQDGTLVFDGGNWASLSGPNDQDLRINNGGIIIITNNANITLAGWADAGGYLANTGSGELRLESGTLTINGQAGTSKIGDRGLVIGEYPGATGIFNMDGGVLNVANAVYVGQNNAPAATGIWNLTGGTANIGELYFAYQSEVSGTLNMSGGVLRIGAGGMTVGSGAATIELDGGTLGSSAPWSSSLPMTFGGTGPAVDTTGGSIALTGSLDGNGGLAKAGPNTLTLSAGGYSGATVVNGGALLVLGLSGSFSVTVNNGGTFGGQGYVNGPVTVNNGGGLTAPNNAQLSLTSLSLGASGSDNMTLNFSADGTSIAGNYAVSGNGGLTVNGTNVVNVTGILPPASPLPSTNTLITYSGTKNGTGVFVVGSLPTGAAGYVIDTGTEIDLVLTTLGPPTLSGINRAGAGAFQLTFSGPSGQTYKVLSSTNVAAPLGTWRQLTSGTFGASAVNYTDSTATNMARFYRIVSP